MIGPIFKNSFKLFSSMEKVMPRKMPSAEEVKSASVLKNERFSFQSLTSMFQASVIVIIMSILK